MVWFVWRVACMFRVVTVAVWPRPGVGKLVRAVRNLNGHCVHAALCRRSNEYVGRLVGGWQQSWYTMRVHACMCV